MSYGYGAGANPFDDRNEEEYGSSARTPLSASYGQRPNAGRAPPSAGFGQRPGPSPAASGYSGGFQSDGNSMEMSSYSPRSGGGGGGGDAVFSEVNEIKQDLQNINQNLSRLEDLRRQMANDVTGRADGEIGPLTATTMALYRNTTERVRQLKSRPEAGQAKYNATVNRVDGELKETIRKYMQVTQSIENTKKGEQVRQIKLVQPGLTDREAEQMAEDMDASGGGVFQQMMMNGNRTMEARRVLDAVRDRHAEIQRIEQQMIELAQLFQDLDTLVVQQQVAVEQIDQKAEEVVDNLEKANDEVVVAVDTARSTRRKKWWCLSIVVAIIAVIVIIVVIYMVVVKGGSNNDNNNDNNNNSSNNNNKRSVDWNSFAAPSFKDLPARGLYGGSKIVKPTLARRDEPNPVAEIFAGRHGGPLRRYVVNDQDWNGGN